MSALGQVARKTGRAAALSAVAIGFFLSAAALLTLAAYLLLAPLYGAGHAVLVLGLVHLGIALVATGAILAGGHGRAAERPTREAAVEDHPAMTLLAAFLSGVSQGAAAGAPRSGPR